VSAFGFLECDNARIDRGGAPAFEGLTFSANGERVALVGDWSALFLLLASRAELVSGKLTLGGRPAESAVRQAAVGLALADPPLPESLTALGYLEHSARLLGMPRRGARAAAGDALERLGAGALAKQQLSDLPRAHRRVVLIAHATLGAPAVLALEAPLAELDERSAGWVHEILWRAASDRSLLLSARYVPPLGPERELLDRMDEVIILESRTVVAHGPPARVLLPARRYRVIASRHASALAARLKERNIAVHVTGDDGALEAFGPGAARELRAARLIIDLPDGTPPGVVLDASLEVDAPVLELLPLHGARDA
jgi:ABC-type multidrug transport system ATPase subunit